jgi:1-acyl-sn-glycerol-3-phosphate acyltransferase
MSKKENWLKFRHKVVVWLLTYPFGLYVRLKYGIRIQPFRQQGNRPYLIVMNHQTAYDQFFVGLTFHRPVYYLASEDLFSMGWVSNLIRYLVAPIPIKKQTTDLQAIKNCIRVAREGGTICLAPEGNRTFHGKTVYMNPSIASLTKKLGLPLAIFRIEGGYGIHPRWSDVVRKGKMRCYTIGAM